MLEPQNEGQRARLPWRERVLPHPSCTLVQWQSGADRVGRLVGLIVAAVPQNCRLTWLSKPGLRTVVRSDDRKAVA